MDDSFLNDDAIAANLGQDLILLLNLKVNQHGRVDTYIGDKTPCGLARTVLRLFNEASGKGVKPALMDKAPATTV